MGLPGGAEQRPGHHTLCARSNRKSRIPAYEQSGSKILGPRPSPLGSAAFGGPPYYYCKFVGQLQGIGGPSRPAASKARREWPIQLALPDACAYLAIQVGKAETMGGERIVEVWGTAHMVRVYQVTNTVWAAEGFYNGQRIYITGGSEASAVAQWRDAAQYKANG